MNFGEGELFFSQFSSFEKRKFLSVTKNGKTRILNFNNVSDFIAQEKLRINTPLPIFAFMMILIASYFCVGKATLFRTEFIRTVF